MKILVFGAGVLGCNLARNLFRAGKDVTLLARGSWAEEIRKNGLRIKDKFSPKVSVSRIPVVTELAPEDTYDVIFVVARYTQLETILDVLRANGTKNVVFVGNNVLQILTIHVEREIDSRFDNAQDKRRTYILTLENVALVANSGIHFTT